MRDGHTPAPDLDPEQIMAYVQHMYDEHIDTQRRRLISECDVCNVTIRAWLDAGLLTFDRIAGIGVAVPPPVDVTGLTDTPPPIRAGAGSMWIAPVGTPPPAPGAGWQDVGTVAGDGIRVAHHTEPPDADPNLDGATWTWTIPPAGPPGPPPVGDILGTVADDGSMLCACGCGSPITDRSPSAYFASQKCSNGWHERRLTPDQVHVLDAPDGVSDDELDDVLRHLAGRQPTSRTLRRIADTQRPRGPWPVTRRSQDLPPAAAWLNEIHDRYTAMAVVTHGAPHRDEHIVTVRVPSAAAHQHQDLAPLAYSRYCPTCHGRVSPYTFTGPHAGHVHVHFHQVQQRCPTCHSIVPGRPMLGWAERYPGNNIVLSLEDGTARDIEMVRLRNWPPTPADTTRVADLWDRMERHLDRFSARYIPSPPSTPAPGDDRPYHLDVPPPPRTRPLLPWRAGGCT